MKEPRELQLRVGQRSEATRSATALRSERYCGGGPFATVGRGRSMLNRVNVAWNR